jgi:glyoxylase-like metal-dependent hydrolase (beta-lactamase superfamily II)
MKRLLAAATAAFFASVLVVASAAAQAPQGPPKRSITKIAGDLYRTQNNFHFGVAYVTPEGVIVGDTINADFAKWLTDEIAKRFNQPVKYVVLSHDHPDHSSGAQVFAEAGAVVIAHDNARRTIVEEHRPTAAPSLTYSDSLTIHLGGKTVEVKYVGRNHSDNMSILHFPAERAVWAVDFIPVKSLAFRDLGESYFPDWIESLQRVEAMDFDILAPGHGPMGAKDDVAAFRGYLQDLQSAVLAGMRAKKTLDQLKAEIKLEKYASWGQYQQFRALNIEGMYRTIKDHRWPG